MSIVAGADAGCPQMQLVFADEIKLPDTTNGSKCHAILLHKRQQTKFSIAINTQRSITSPVNDKYNHDKENESR